MRHRPAVWLAGAFCLLSGAAIAGTPTPATKPAWVSEPVALQIGLVAPDVHASFNDTLGAEDRLLSRQDRTQYKQAFAAAEKGHWQQALRLASTAKDATLGKVIRWLWISAPGTDAGFDEIASFVADNPHWPRMRRVQSQAEDKLDETVSDKRVLAWFHNREPVTGWGSIRLAEALMADGQRSKGESLLRQTWAKESLTTDQARATIKRHGKLLTRADHIGRLDELLWDGRVSEARRMFGLVSDDYRRLAEARIALMTRNGNVDALIGRVPASLREDPGLQFERTRWRRRAGMGESAREYLLNPPDNLGRPERWWDERSLLAREALGDGHVSAAYQLIKDHRLESGADFAEAEWMAGWIALTFLRDGEAALSHFNHLHEGVNYPVSLARAAYWSGRAADALSRSALAKKWYDKAGQYPTTYYGQMAALRLKQVTTLDLPPDPEPDAADIARFNGKELVRIVQLLAEVGVADEIHPFILQLNDEAKTPGEHVLVAGLGVSIGRPDLAVASAKRSLRAGVLIASLSYPSVPLIEEQVDTGLTPLLHAVLRQESQFNPGAVSSAGAKGLMQLMPQTAKLVAKSLNMRFTRTRLVTDPEYNLRIGKHYLDMLVRKYDGSYPLALAAYNAGESRVNRWVRQWGDPRKAEIDAVDWIELIPFEETRNYVQRVLENLQVYRHRLSGGSAALRLNDDLARVPSQPATSASGCSC